MKSLQQVALSMKITEQLGLPEIHKPLQPAPEQPILNCFYCGVVLHYDRTELPCLKCEGTGKTPYGGGGECYHCDGSGVWIRSGMEYRPDAYTRDHVIPRKQGGSNRKENIVDCCRLCNTTKGREDARGVPALPSHKERIRWRLCTISLSNGKRAAYSVSRM